MHQNVKSVISPSYSVYSISNFPLLNVTLQEESILFVPTYSDSLNSLGALCDTRKDK